MACGSCSKRRNAANKGKIYDVMAGYKHLPNNQIKARLEIFKKKHCNSCNDRYDCNFKMYTECVKKPK